MKLTLGVVTGITVGLYFILSQLNDEAISDALQTFGHADLDDSLYLPNFTWELSPFVNICIILICEYLLGWNKMLIPIIYGGAILIPLIDGMKIPFSMTYQIILMLSLWTQKWFPFFISFGILYIYDTFQDDHVLAPLSKRLNNNLIQTLILNAVPVFYFVVWKQKYTWLQVAIIFGFLFFFIYKMQLEDVRGFTPPPAFPPGHIYNFNTYPGIPPHDEDTGMSPLPGIGFAGINDPQGRDWGTTSDEDSDEEEDGHTPFDESLI